MGRQFDWAELVGNQLRLIHDSIAADIKLLDLMREDPGAVPEVPISDSRWEELIRYFGGRKAA